MPDTIQLSDILHSQIARTCLGSFEQEQYADAARKAMIMVEAELRHRANCSRKMYGRRLVQHVFRQGNPLQLIVTLEGAEQEEARALFEGAFAYYRNYVMHNLAGIDRRTCIVVLLIASELMTLIGASSFAFRGLETLVSLLDAGKIASWGTLERLLRYLDGHVTLDDTYDGMFEDLLELGVSDETFELVHDIGLIEWEHHDYSPEPDEMYPPEFLDIAHLTPAGEEALRLCIQADQAKQSPAT
ncbi:MAG: TIGR02391 family protein [Bacteroidota bacterium]